MTIKLLFDECVGKPVMDSLPGFLSFSSHAFHLMHVLEKQAQGEWDEKWIPALATEGWIVVTGDRGKRGGRKKGEKLPILCRQYGITHIMLGPSLHHQDSFAKLQAIVAVWDQIVLLPSAPAGSAYLLSSSEGRIRLAMRKPNPPRSDSV